MRRAQVVGSLALSFSLALPVALPLAACSTTTGPAPAAVIVSTESTGTLVVSWTIAMHADADTCARARASAVRVELTTDGGADAGSYEQSCSVYSTSIRLEPSAYQGSAVLLDAAGEPVTAIERMPSFTILGGDVVATPIDFSVATFTPD